ncbi:Pimeloyl-ACP methyl ester carboxylesterase [Parasphingorhabdus marina DSM 22363]|uniref:Pimeloyl-ACP methyl ester carboxylesterase n=1 Tax=Parasphingorhabdus marina DSM 22363 TaxID=1123272 RepID=A0A1N6DAZ3_9SPHN|nr:alpha/beta hydrolase [Parasphingorhabdus marina]SIN67907.1 Pimeloyl-ACP methyl ester carboxylesterase [Parasphingorhabdus marina DSM 22363]
MQRKYVTLSDGRQVHYRHAGQGPAMLLLHPSPQCSEAIVPALMALSEVCECHALDTPGYGLSDDISEAQPDMGHYADSVIATADALGMEQFYLYGAATGSQIAIELGKRYPDRVKMIMLDTNGHVSDEDRCRVLDGYFPDVTPRRDGGHLMTYWDMCRHLFVSFPWQSERVEDRLGVPLPPVEVIQTIFLRYLRAGSGYARAYRPAFETEKRAHMDGLNVPTTMMRWEGSIALAITDALIAEGVPDCLEILHAGPALEDRYRVQVEALRKGIAAHGDTPALQPQRNTCPAGKLERCYFASGDMQIHAQINREGEGRPLILIHDALGSSDQIRAQAERHVGKRPAMLVDLPGHGASTENAEAIPGSAKSFAQAVAPAIAAFTGTAADVEGVGLGGAIAAELSRLVPVQNVQLVDPVPFTDAERNEAESSAVIDLSPEMDGSHLSKAWAMVIDSEFYWPWFNNTPAGVRTSDACLNPEWLHLRVSDMLRTGLACADLIRLGMSVDWRQVFDGLERPADVILSDRHPCPDRLDSWQVRTAN